jgi:hypothetical protein
MSGPNFLRRKANNTANAIVTTPRMISTVTSSPCVISFDRAKIVAKVTNSATPPTQKMMGRMASCFSDTPDTRELTTAVMMRAIAPSG